MKKLATALALGLTLALSSCSGASGPAGTYNLDAGKFGESMMSKMMGDKAAAMPAEEKTKMLDEMKKNISGLMTVKADKTWTMAMNTKMGGMDNKSKVTGTWKLDGEKITMTGADENKKEQTITGTFKGGKLVLTNDGMTMEFNPAAKAK